MKDVVEILTPDLLIDAEQDTLLVEVPGPASVIVDNDTDVVTTTDLELVVTETAGEVLLVSANEQGPPGIQGPAGQAGAAYVTFPAGVALGGNRLVRLSAGAAMYADCTDLTAADIVLGFTRGAVAVGLPAEIQTTGLMTEPSWAWQPDKPVFVGINGVPTQTPPAVGFSLIVGVATSPTQIFIGAKMPIVLE